VSDLASSAPTGMTPATPPPTYDSDAGFLPTPQEPAATGAPAAAGDDTAVSAEPAAEPGEAVTEPSVPAVPDATNDDLLDIKQQALQQLTPLVGHLDQTPEEKFRTTMMMIQASDNQALLKDAYAAAQTITDEKTRAQALLDVINEINYFTQKPQESAA